jgi:hypothetical protein
VSTHPIFRKVSVTLETGQRSNTLNDSNCVIMTVHGPLRGLKQTRCVRLLNLVKRCYMVGECTDGVNIHRYSQTCNKATNSIQQRPWEANSALTDSMNHSQFKEQKGSLPSSQGSVTGLCPGPGKSSPHPQTLFWGSALKSPSLSHAN